MSKPKRRPLSPPPTWSGGALALAAAVAVPLASTRTSAPPIALTPVENL